MHPIKTVLLLQDLDLGGTQRHALELARRLDPERFETSIWTLMGEGGFLPKAREYGLRVRRLGTGRAVTPAGLFGLWRALRAEKPDVLMALTVVPNIWGRVLGRLAGVPAVIANCRGGDDLWRQHERVLRDLAHFHICNAHALRQALTARYALPPERVEVIPTGVDTQHFSPRPGEGDPGPVILCLARLSPVKDHETLIAAFEKVSPAHPGALLRMVGDGELRDKLAARVDASPAGDRMELLPGVPDPREHFARAGIAVLSSANEGMPNALLEAMAMGLPCVGTDVGGVGELIRHGRTGLVVPAGDPAAMAGALDRLLSDEAFRLSAGAAGRATAVAEHALSGVAERHAAILERVLEERLRRGA